MTKKLGSDTEYTVDIDVHHLATRDGDEEISVQEKSGLRTSQHYTRIEISELNRDIPPRTLGTTKRYLVQMYKPDVLAGVMQLFWDGEQMRPSEEVVLETDGRTWKQDVEFEVGGKKVTGWVGILGEGARGRGSAGFNLYRRGRGVIIRPPGYRPERIFGENRNDLLNQRLFGDLNLDGFNVNHLKDDFLWDGDEETFEDELRKAALDYIQKAREYRPTRDGHGVPPAVVQTTDDQIVEELTDQAAVDQLAIMEVIQPLQDEDPAVREARAEMFRSQPGREPRIFEVGRYTFSVYHPENMAATETYFVQESSRADHIDIFINDNHPYAVKAAEATPLEYPMYARMCCYDAIVEYFLVHHPGELSPRFPAKLKDALLRTRTL